MLLLSTIGKVRYRQSSGELNCSAKTASRDMRPTSYTTTSWGYRLHATRCRGRHWTGAGRWPVTLPRMTTPPRRRCSLRIGMAILAPDAQSLSEIGKGVQGFQYPTCTWRACPLERESSPPRRTASSPLPSLRARSSNWAIRIVGRRIATLLDPGKLASGRYKNSDPDRDGGTHARRSVDRESSAH